MAASALQKVSDVQKKTGHHVVEANVEVNRDTRRCPLQIHCGSKVDPMSLEKIGSHYCEFVFDIRKLDKLIHWLNCHTSQCTFQRISIVKSYMSYNLPIKVYLDSMSQALMFKLVWA